MVIRIVRLHLKENRSERFKELFYASKPEILKFAGCQQVDLFVDKNDTNIYYTHSLWDTEEHLNDYRESKFFEGTWREVKKLFADKPQAFSMESV